VTFTVQKLAEVKGLPSEEVAAAILTNARRVLGTGI
jgi:Tat protein secretion system quality control protein TatD with DNase activity